MAARILAKRKVIAYLPNLNAAVKHFSSFNYIDKIITQSQNFHSKFPASESTQFLFNETNNLKKDISILGSSSFNESKTSEIEYDVLNQFYDNKFQTKETIELELKPSTMDSLECLAVECSEGMKKDFKCLFIDRDFHSDPALSVITLSQKTTNDMSSWSPEVEEEREALLLNFIEGAKDICCTLKGLGYWADFVEPESGRPFYSAYTTDTFFETDHRYKKLGFQINDLGCCKVVVHSVWGVHVYVGSLFTNAPIDHPAITKLNQCTKIE